MPLVPTATPEDVSRYLSELYRSGGDLVRAAEIAVAPCRPFSISQRSKS